MLPYIYFLKVILCSGILLGYYFLVLRNKIYHQYNRFYLLVLFLGSWLIPLIHININKETDTQNFVQQTIQTIAVTNANFETEIIQPATISISWQAILNYSFWAVCSVLFFIMLWRFLKLWSIVFRNATLTNKIIFSKINGTPFSFFNYIFWNPEIDITSNDAYQILLHEYEHVKQKHSIDKVLVQLVLVVGWINPFFWIARKELFLIHEFMADKKAVEQGNVDALAKLLLVSSYPSAQHLFTNSFFFSPIKRRLIMITKNTSPQFTHYLQKLVALPVTAMIIALVAFKTTENPKNFGNLSKQYTIVVDAGHGGNDLGVIAADGTTEKQISLQLAMALKAANTNPNLNIMLTREDDVFSNVKDKALMANDLNPDIFISFHVNDAPKGSKQSGFEIYVSTKDNDYSYESKLLAQNISNNLPTTIPNLGIKQRMQGIYVLQAVKAPSIIIEAGYLSNVSDATYIKNKNNQEELVKRILLGVEQFLANQEKSAEVIIEELKLEKAKDVKTNDIAISDMQLEKQTPSTTEATSEELETYNALVDKYFSNKKENLKNIETLPKNVKDQMVAIYIKMSKQQQEKQTVCFVKHPGYLKKEVPNQDQLNNWLKPDVYGIWIDDKRVTNDKLKQYKPTDFSLFTASKLSKNAVNYKYHKVQINLMTNNYYNNYVAEAKKQANEYLLMLKWKS